MSIYRVHFKWQETDFILKAESLDLSHPYFVSIKKIILPEYSALLVNPADEKLRKTFGKSEHLMIPFQAVSMIEEFKEDPDKGTQNSPVSIVP